ncbi:MAG: PorP/SprF family type IX secretion system membrane protein [Chitinophagales bacterium]|nr:PorP/SprF family type IX secretion system membrane protein [Chitinophagales bacterium]
MKVSCHHIWINGFLLVLSFAFYSKSNAQVNLNSTHVSTWHTQMIQPAFMGQSDGIRAFASYRYQWVGIEGSPMTIYAGVDMKLPIKNSSGGLLIAHDRLGLASYTSASISYAYTIPIKKSSLNLGANIGMVGTILDGTKLTTPSMNQPIEDPNLSLKKESGFRANIAFGIAYIHPIFYVHTFVDNLSNFKTKMNGLKSELRIDNGRYLGIGMGASVPVHEKFSINPNFLFKSDLVNYQLDISLSSTYKEKYSLGIGARGYNKMSFESLFFITKVQILDNLEIMYSFDMIFNALKSVNHGSHEVSFQYIIPKKYISNRSKIVNHPRYL